MGPAESDEVVAAGPALGGRGLPFVSPSARRPGLTSGSPSAFFRVIPHDGVQAPTLATFVQKTLGARKAAIVDDGSGYGVPIADSLEHRLTSAGVGVTRLTTDPELTDFAAVLAAVKPAVDVVVLAWQAPAQAQVFADQLRATNKRAVVVGTDALDATAFKLEGAYVSTPLPDVHVIQRNAAFLARYRKLYGPFSTTLGPPAYAAAQAAILAVKNACRDGTATRAEVKKWLRRTFIPESILGSTIAFTDRGDLRGARFSVFRIENGTKRLVWGAVNK